MEMVSYLAGEEWSDSPACTHPVLARAAQVVNDRLPDSERHLLVPLIGRLFGTAAPADEHEAHVLSVRLAVWCAREVLPMVRASDRAVCERAIVTAEAWCEGRASKDECNAATSGVSAGLFDASAAASAVSAAAAAAASAAAAVSAAASAAVAAAASAANAAAAAYAANAAALIPFLTGLLDEYDRLTGRTDHRPVTDADLATLAALTH